MVLAPDEVVIIYIFFTIMVDKTLSGFVRHSDATTCTLPVWNRPKYVTPTAVCSIQIDFKEMQDAELRPMIRCQNYLESLEDRYRRSIPTDYDKAPRCKQDVAWVNLFACFHLLSLLLAFMSIMCIGLPSTGFKYRHFGFWICLRRLLIMTFFVYTCTNVYVALRLFVEYFQSCIRACMLTVVFHCHIGLSTLLMHYL